MVVTELSAAARRVRSGDAAGGERAIPIATVSGVASTNTAMIEWFDRETDVAVITTKSIQLDPNPGYREPIITEPHPGSFGNAVGLKNPGVEAAVEALTTLRRRHTLRARLIVSISGNGVDEFVALAARVAPVADMIELNYSCPHAASGYGADIGRDERAIEEITRAVVAASAGVAVLVKVTPNVPDIARMAMIACAAGAAGIVAINTVGPERHLHAETGSPILSHERGGKSGRWVYETARDAIGAIREAIGAEPLVIGMGGVERREQVRELVRAGADVVGVGSALSRLHQRDWPAYLAALGKGDGTAAAEHHPVMRDEAGMRYRAYRVRERRELGEELFELELDGELPFEPGQAVFLWVPGVGEKPFSPALATPATFLIRRRGATTRALGALDVGDTVYARGPYGDGHAPDRGVHAVIVGAGSGMALLPAIGRRVLAAGGTVRALIGTREPLAGGAVEAALRRMGAVTAVPDMGRVGRVLSFIAPEVTTRDDLSRTRLYIVGPEPFMVAGAALAGGTTPTLVGEGGVARGGESGTDVATRSSTTPHGEAADPDMNGVIPLSQIIVSLERPMRCGVGMCGECHCHGRLTCQYGTFVTAEEWLHG